MEFTSQYNAEWKKPNKTVSIAWHYFYEKPQDVKLTYGDRKLSPSYIQNRKRILIGNNCSKQLGHQSILQIKLS